MNPSVDESFQHGWREIVATLSPRWSVTRPGGDHTWFGHERGRFCWLMPSERVGDGCGVRLESWAVEAAAVGADYVIAGDRSSAYTAPALAEARMYNVKGHR